MDPPEIVPSVTELSISEGSGDEDITINSNLKINFDSSNWNDPQTVILGAAEDDLDVLNSAAVIGFSASGFSTVNVRTIELDNDFRLTLVRNSRSNRTRIWLSLYWLDWRYSLYGRFHIPGIYGNHGSKH